MISHTVWPTRIVNPEPLGTTARGWCRDLLRRLEALDIAEHFPDFLDRCAHLEDLDATAVSARFDLKAEIQTAASRLADGEVTIEQASEIVAQAERDGRAADVAREVMTAAIHKASNRAADDLARLGDEIITGTLHPLIADVTEEWADLAPTIPPEVDNDTDAMRSDPDVRVAWGRLIELEERAAQVWDLADRLRNARVLPTPRRLHNVYVGEFRWQHPELLPQVPSAHVPHPILGFSMALASGAGAAVLTADEVVNRTEIAA